MMSYDLNESVITLHVFFYIKFESVFTYMIIEVMQVLAKVWDTLVNDQETRMEHMASIGAKFHCE